MKTIIYTEYGSPEVLKIKDMDKPAPKDNEILIRVRAASVNFGDLLARNFGNVTPQDFNMLFLFWLMARASFGFNKPKVTTLGSEFSGDIEAVGKDVKRFKPGEAVFGYVGQKMGAYAEYLCISEDGCLASKPTNLSYAEAAALPMGAMTALSLLRKVNIQPGQKVLINGASGGIGSAAVQLAKYFGANVTGVCSTPRMEYVKSLGADHVLDYTKDDFTQNGETYDLIFDVLGRSSFERCKSSLKQNGRLLYASFKMKQIVEMLWTSLTGSHKVICALSMESPAELLFIKELVEAGKIRSVVDRSFPMEQAVEAHRYGESGSKKGSVVITMGGNQ